MSDDILKQVELARHIGNLISRVRTLERSQNLAQRTEDLSSASDPTDGNPQENRFIFYPSIVASVIDDSTFLANRARPDATTPWVADPFFASKPLTVTVPAGVSVPTEESVVGVFFTGTYSVAPGFPAPRYGLFGAGGSVLKQTIIKSVGNDHLVVRSWVASVTGTEDILVAKNFKNRRTPFDGLTKDGYSYVYSTAVDRVVTIAASVGFSQLETVIPRYELDDVIYIQSVEEPTDVVVTVSGTPTDVSFIDMNNDNREFVRTGTT